MRVFFAGLKQLADILGDLNARLIDADSGAVVHQQRIGLHDAVNGGFHGILLGWGLAWDQMNSVANRRSFDPMASASRMPLASPTTSTFVTFKPRSTSMNPRSPMRTDKAHAGNKFHRGKFIFLQCQKTTRTGPENRTDALGK